MDGMNVGSDGSHINAWIPIETHVTACAWRISSIQRIRRLYDDHAKVTTMYCVDLYPASHDP